MNCSHDYIEADCDLQRIVEGDETAPPIAFSLDVRVHCQDCGESFVFIGFPVGSSPRQPTQSLDGTEVRLPCRPESAPATFGLDGPGAILRVHDERGDMN